MTSGFKASTAVSGKAMDPTKAPRGRALTPDQGVRSKERSKSPAQERSEEMLEMLDAHEALLSDGETGGKPLSGTGKKIDATKQTNKQTNKTQKLFEPTDIMVIVQVIGTIICSS